MAASEAEALRERIRAVIGRGAAGPLPDGEFNELALAVFRHQFAHGRIYRAFCESRGVAPRVVEHWTEIPAVPTDAFKVAPLLTGEPEQAAAVFRTSGTTAGAERRGAHHLLDLALYDAALRAGFAAHLLPDAERLPILSLIPPPEEASDSSLSYMIGGVVRSFGAPGSGFFVGGSGIAYESLLRALEGAERDGRPLLLAGTSFAFVHLLDRLAREGRSARLPPGSRIMDTGGFKGRSREVARDELYALMGERLGVPAAWIVNEYGMTEMSSQLYDGAAGSAAEEVAGRLHRGPAWVRSLAYDPESLRPLESGEVGVVRHWDLANLDSVLVLQTADLGRVLPEGVRLLGRARGAEARGCSIAMDELLGTLRG
jgi:hypothetical protein